MARTQTSLACSLHAESGLHLPLSVCCSYMETMTWGTGCDFIIRQCFVSTGCHMLPTGVLSELLPGSGGSFCVWVCGSLLLYLPIFVSFLWAHCPAAQGLWTRALERAHPECRSSLCHLLSVSPETSCLISLCNRKTHHISLQVCCEACLRQGRGR